MTSFMSTIRGVLKESWEPDRPSTPTPALHTPGAPGAVAHDMDLAAIRGLGITDNLHISTALDLVRKGKSPSDAASLVKKMFFTDTHKDGTSKDDPTKLDHAPNIGEDFPDNFKKGKDDKKDDDKKDAKKDDDKDDKKKDGDDKDKDKKKGKKGDDCSCKDGKGGDKDKDDKKPDFFKKKDESAEPNISSLVEKHIGFAKLKGKLAHKKGIRNPAAVAAAIGREKYGAKGMAAKAHHETVIDRILAHALKKSAQPIVETKEEDDSADLTAIREKVMLFVQAHESYDEWLEGDEYLKQELDEVLGSGASASAWIHDFVHSENPKFEGKSKKKRIQMALGAYYAKHRGESVDPFTV